MQYVVDRMDHREGLKPLADDWEQEEEEEEEEGKGAPANKSRKVVVIGAGAAGLAAASTLQVCGLRNLPIHHHRICRHQSFPPAEGGWDRRGAVGGRERGWGKDADL